MELPWSPYDETSPAGGIPAVVQRPPSRAPVHKRERARDAAERDHHLDRRVSVKKLRLRVKGWGYGMLKHEGKTVGAPNLVATMIF